MSPSGGPRPGAGRKRRATATSDVSVTVRVTAAERAAWEAKAERRGKDLSSWIRELANRAK